MSHWNAIMSNPTPARLPHTVLPSHYRVYLKPNLERLSFKGRVDIDIQIYIATREVVLHSEELEIYNVRLKSDSNLLTYFQIKGAIYDLSSNLTSLLFDETLVKGSKMVLSMEFKGNIDPTDTHGFFRSQLIESDVTKNLLMTNLERNYARRLLPCWDEPEFKATFQVSLEVPMNLSVLSNSNIERVKPKRNGHKEVHFKRTPPMSTYLLAISIGDLNYIEGVYFSALSEKSVQCRVYSLRKPNDAMKFILKTAIETLDFFERLFNMPYELPKLDFVTVPGLTWPMENWGLITLGDKLELDFESSESLIVGAREVAHEIAHQWFGNLVTIRWWSDLWLKEGFAVYFELLAIDTIYPEYKVLSDFYNNDMLRLLFMEDSSMTPLHKEVSDPRNVGEDFIDTLYVKGAIVLSMINQTISDDKFRGFIRSYLKRYKFDSITMDDFYSEIIVLSNGDLEVFYDVWVRRKERPYLCVTEGKGRKPNEGIIKITQKFTNSESDQHLYWPMPIKIVIFTPSKEYRTVFLVHRTIHITVQKDEPYLIYPDENSYFRVQYSKSSIIKIKAHFENKKLSVQERTRLIDDAGALFKKTYSSFALLNMLQIFLYEDDNDVLCDINVHTNALFSFWSNIPELTPDFDRIKRRLYTSVYNNRSITENKKDTTVNPNLQLYIMRNLISLGNYTILYQAENLFHEFKGNRTILTEESQEVIFAMLVSVDSQYNLDQLFSIYPLEFEEDPQDLRGRIVNALISGHPKLLPRILEWCQSTDNLLTFYTQLRYAPASHQRIALDFLLRIWATLPSHYHPTELQLILTATTSWIASREDAFRLQEFFIGDESKLDIGSIVHAIEVRAQVIDRDRFEIRLALDEILSDWQL